MLWKLFPNSRIQRIICIQSIIDDEVFSRLEKQWELVDIVEKQKIDNEMTCKIWNVAIGLKGKIKKARKKKLCYRKWKSDSSLVKKH